MITRLPCAKHSLGASMRAKAIAISTVPTWVSVLRPIGRWAASHRCSRRRMWRWLRRFSARGPASLGELDQSSPRVPAGQPGHLTGSVASCVPWNAKCSKRVGRCYHRGNWCDDAEARGSPDPRWMAPLPGLRMRGQCPVLSKLPAVRGCMVSRDHLGRGAFVHKVEKRDEGKVGASTNSPKLHVGAGMLMCALNRHSCTRA